MTAAIFQNDPEPTGTTAVPKPSLAEIAAMESIPWPVRAAEEVQRDLADGLDLNWSRRELSAHLGRAEMALKMLLGYIGELNEIRGRAS